MKQSEQHTRSSKVARTAVPPLQATQQERDRSVDQQGHKQLFNLRVERICALLEQRRMRC